MSSEEFQMGLNQEEIDELTLFVEENIDFAVRYQRRALVSAIRKLPDSEYGAGRAPREMEE